MTMHDKRYVIHKLMNIIMSAKERPSTISITRREFERLKREIYEMYGIYSHTTNMQDGGIRLYGVKIVPTQVWSPTGP